MTLREVKSLSNAIVRGEQMPDYSAPESFNVMIKELQGLCIDVELD